MVESTVRKKKSRGGLNVFQFAQTVEDNTWEDDQQRMALRVCSTSLLFLSLLKQCTDHNRMKYLALRKLTPRLGMYRQPRLKRSHPLPLLVPEAILSTVNGIQLYSTKRFHSPDFQRARMLLVSQVSCCSTADLICPKTSSDFP